MVRYALLFDRGCYGSAPLRAWPPGCNSPYVTSATTIDPQTVSRMFDTAYGTV